MNSSLGQTYSKPINIGIRETRKLEFSWLEYSGSLGDLGLFIPLVVGISLMSGLDLGRILVTAGLMNIATGLIFRIPLPVQPMKAIAAAVIAEELAAGEMLAAGILMGILLSLLALTGTADFVNRRVPKAIVRGIQAGVGIKLFLKGLSFLSDRPIFGWDSYAIAIASAVLIFILHNRKNPILLYLFGAGFLLLYWAEPGSYGSVRFTFPSLVLHWPAPEDWLPGLTRGALPQLPLTLLNSVVAVCALSADYFPKRRVSPRGMALSLGVMNLISAPLGGVPFCHGSGGLAAQYRFGARTGGSVIMLGITKVIVGVGLGSAILTLLNSYPRSILGVLLATAGLELAKAARDMVRSREILVVSATAVSIILVNTLAGVLVGSCTLLLLKVSSRDRSSTPGSTPH
jgi:MFS superfamily sulfate permease-like transporter